MTRHDLNMRPSAITIDGVEWVPAEWAYGLEKELSEKQRSQQSHNHQFAEINDLWANLPQYHKDAPYAKSAKAFRKHGLIETGHCDVDTIDCETHEVALRVAPVIAKKAREAHGYALTVVRGPLVVCSTPHSQRYKAMGKDKFHQSKRDVLDWGHRILGVSQ